MIPQTRAADHDTQDFMLTWVSLVHAGSYLPAALSQHLQERLGISLAEQDLLKQLGVAGGELTMGELSRRIYLSKAGITKMMDRLEAGGFVKRVRPAGDRRIIHARLTKAGRNTLDASRKLLVPWVRENLGDHLSARQFRSLGKALETLLKAHDRWEGQMAHLAGQPGT